MQSDWKSLLKKSLNEAGLPGEALTAPPEGSSAQINIRGLLVNLEYDAGNNRLHLYCSLGVLPRDPGPALCERLLEANLLGAETGGGHIGLYGATRALLYSLGLEADRLDGTRLANALNLFTEKSVALIAEVERASCGQAETPQDSPLASPLLGNMLWG